MVAANRAVISRPISVEPIIKKVSEMQIGNRCLKVLQVYRTYFPDTQGGLQEAIRQIALNVGPGVEMKIFTLSPFIDKPEKMEVDGVKVIRIPQAFEISSCGFAWRGLSLFKEACQWADVVHYHFPWPFGDLLELLIGRSQGKVQVVTYHSDIVRQKYFSGLYSPLMRNFFRNISCIIATSPAYANSSLILKDYKNKVDIIPLGISEGSYPEIEEEELSALRHTYGDDFFLFVGVLRYYKCLDTLLEAAALVPDKKILIVGEGPEGTKLRQKARAMKLENVIFIGRVNDQTKMCLLNLCRAFVLPSHQRSEAFGVSLLEAAMCSKPLISAEIGTGTTYVNCHEETGLVVEPGCEKSLARAICRLSNPGLAVSMGQQARRRYEQLFTGERMGMMYQNLYFRLADKESLMTERAFSTT